jgi:sigma-B regulation protein RsbU (phosphoserine phosphatase)
MDDLENRRNKFELKAILDSSRLLIESHDSDFIMSNLLLNLMGKLMITKSAVFMYDQDEDYYYATHTKGRLSFTNQERIKWQIEDFQKTQTVHVETKKNDTFPTLFWDNDLKTVVHIKTSNQYLGFILLGPKLNKEPLSQREIDFITSLVIILSVSIANSQLFSDLKQANRSLDKKVQELHTLFDLSKEFSSTVDRSQILRIFKFALLGQMFIKSFYLIFDRNGARQVLVKNGVPKQITDENLLSTYDQVNEPIYLEYFQDCPVKELDGLNFQLLLPLRLQDKKQAVLGVGSRANQEKFTESDINFLYSLGNLVLMSIQKTYLLEEQIEKERIEKELNIARDIQKRLLPDKLPPIEGYQIAALNEPSQFVGGDYYDIIQTGDDKVVLAIADVTGKGIPASLIMANLQAMLHLLNDSELDLPAKTGKINNIIYENTPPDIFITFFWGILNTRSNTFSYVNAGHNAPLLYRASTETFEELNKGGLLIGALKTMMPYQSETVSIQPDDVLVFFTDGVTEAMDEQDEEYEENRLKSVIKTHRTKSAQEIKEVLVDDVKTFCNNQLGDDLTLIILKRLV